MVKKKRTYNPWKVLIYLLANLIVFDLFLILGLNTLIKSGIQLSVNVILLQANKNFFGIVVLNAVLNEIMKRKSMDFCELFT